jgi:hypothetical protein
VPFGHPFLDFFVRNLSGVHKYDKIGRRWKEARNGGMAEWFKAPVLKTGVGQLTVGSNPSPSAEGCVNKLLHGEVPEWLNGLAC